MADDLDATLSAARADHAAGRVAAAEAGYRAVLERRPDDAESLHGLGVIGLAAGRVVEAGRLVLRAMAADPDAAAYPLTLSAAYLAANQPGDALGAADRAAGLDAGSADAQANRGFALDRLGRAAEAVNAHAAAVERGPGRADLHLLLGHALRRVGRMGEAADAYGRAAALDRDGFEAHNDGGVSLLYCGRAAESVPLLRRAAALRPGRAGTNTNLANALQATGDWPGALAAFARAAALDPNDPAVGVANGMARLTVGDFAGGWAAYEGRLRLPAAVRSRWDHLPRWRGEPLGGRRVVLWAEQGLGDAVQFARYVPVVAGRGGRVVLEVQPAVRRLLAATPGAEAVIARAEPAPAGVALQCPLLSVPGAVGTTAETVPPATPVWVDAAAVGRWRERWGDGRRDRRTVGLCWAGSPTHGNDRNRSVPAAALLPLAGVAGVRWVSLQKGGVPGPPGLPLDDVTGAWADLADTAAAIAAMDAVVTVDTAVAHVAAAVGTATIVMLPYVPDFRWLLGRADSPWYPSVRLVRQPAFGEWGAVVAAVTSMLAGGAG